MDDNLNLKPCPFCGGAAEVSKTPNMWIVECNNAGCGSNPDVLAAFKHDAITAWNRRSADASGAVELTASINDDAEFHDLAGDVYRAGAHNESIEKPMSAFIAHIDAYAARRAASNAGAWISVAERLPETGERPYQVAAICVKKYDENSNYPGQGKRGVYQDWVLRKWPQNFTHWMPLPAAPVPPAEGA